MNALRAFDDEVAYLRTAIRAIHELRNHIIPIHRFPSEVLAHIFSISKVIDPPRRYHLGWIRTSHVCRYWREVTIEHPKLWTKISLDLGEIWVSEMLKRAKNSSLVFKSSFIGGSADLITPHWPRIKAIILSSHVDSFPKRQFFETPAPIMEHIDLSVEAHSHFRRLPMNLFSGHAPLLRTAYFSRIAIPWSSPVFHNLISLEVHHDYTVNHSISSSNTFFDALSNMRSLETLTVWNSLPPCLISSSDQPQRTFALSRLSSLGLRGSWSRCMAFLEIVEFPPLATMNLFLTCEEGLSMHSLLPVLKRQSGKMGLAPRLRTVRMVHLYTSWTRFYGWLHHCNPHDSSEIAMASFTLTLDYKAGQPLFDCDILEALLTPETVISSLAVYHAWDLAMFRNAIELARDLEHIFLSVYTLPIFCTAMDTQTGTTALEQTPADSCSELVPFPSLECIHLHDLRLSPQSNLDLLTSVLKQRSTSRSPIQKVEIIKSKLPQEWVDELLTIVPIVSFSPS